MSLELYEDEIRKKFSPSGISGSGKSIHEHAASQLLYTKIFREKKDKNGNTVKDPETGESLLEEITDIESRTILPSPANSTTFFYYGSYLDKAFGNGKGDTMKTIDETYMKRMPSKNGTSRNQFVQVAAPAALAAQTTDGDLMKKVQES